MAENNYMTLCPHCEQYIPARTFRRHREEFFNFNTNSWNKDPGLGDSSDEESAFIENDHSSWSPSCFHDHSESESSDGLFNQTPINNEIWDDVLEHEIDEDTFCRCGCITTTFQSHPS